jgi:hypothetical protein
LGINRSEIVGHRRRLKNFVYRPIIKLFTAGDRVVTEGSVDFGRQRKVTRTLLNVIKIEIEKYITKIDGEIKHCRSE